MKSLVSSCRVSAGIVAAVAGLASTGSLAQTVMDHMSVVARFVEKLKAAPHGEGNLLDHSPMLYGSPMANLFLELAAKEGIELDNFGDSTGRLEI